MSKLRKDFYIPFITVIADAVAMETAFLFSYWLRFYSPLTLLIPVTYGLAPLRAYLESSVFVIPIWLWLFQQRGMYRPRRAVFFSDECFAIIRLVCIGMMLMMAATFFYREFSYSRVVFFYLAMSAIFFLLFERFWMMKFEQSWYAHGNDLKQIVIIGTNAVAQQMYRSISARPQLGYTILGYFSMDGGPSEEMQQVPLLGSIQQTSKYLKEHHIDVVLITLTEAEHPLLPEFIRDCQGLNVEIMMVPDVLELMTSQVQIKHLNGIPFFSIKAPALTTWNAILKRSFDIVFAVCILLLISPLFLLTMLLIKLDSYGPIFYLQERVGLDGALFTVMKFRSMRVNAEQQTGPVWTKKNDPRTTRIGKLLRRFSIDELPQLLNVIKGDMSLVGPRPERPHFVEQFKHEIPKYLERHRVKTGMTGWAQVNGLRGNAPIAERTKYDVYYVENWSLVFDVQIILKTMRAVLFGSDAY
ncbi:MAG TPA: undecaprenyl-phosphate glucose phosphotransferase [Bacteroidota bacterium]|nr:undecaprenyl-phosphate glucose phosphotransferase [Bacteroidota bacterium]